MFLLLYLLTLGISSGCAGLFARRFLASQGFAPTLQTGIIVTAGVACAFAVTQLLYMAFLRIVKPTKAGAPLVTEALSQSAALLLVPYLIGLAIPWPYDILHKVEPLIYLSAFGGIHCFFKLVTLFATTQSPPASRTGALGWLGASLVCLYAMYLSFALWNESLVKARSVTLAEAGPAAIGAEHAVARRIPEGATYRFEVAGHAGQNLALRWAPAADNEAETLKTIQVTVEIDGQAAKPQIVSLELRDDGWAEMVIPAAHFPADAKTCGVTWSAAKIPDWIMQTGLRPVSVSSREMLMSGPWFHDLRAEAKEPNIILLAIDGLSSESVSALGYSRSTTSALDEFGIVASTFANAYTPAPEAAAACMTLLTGVNPLLHRYLGGRQGPLPEGIQTLPEVLQAKRYVTAAFTEGHAPGDEDLCYGSGFERGFEVFDDEFRLETPAKAAGGLPSTAQVPAGSSVTLNKAAEWIEAHSAEKFSAFIRLRELGNPLRLPRYGEGFLGRGRTPTPKDIYDTALASVDQEIGEFLHRIQARPGLDNTCVVIASAYGFDFSEPGRAEWRQGGQPKRTLAESSLRVPVYIYAPGEMGRQRAALVSLEDVAPALLKLANAAFSHQPVGRNLFEGDASREPVSMLGDPLALSIRTRKWRFTWQSGQSPFGAGAQEEPADLALVDIDRYLAVLGQSDNLKREPMLAAGFRERLRKYLEKYAPAEPGKETLQQ